MLWYSWQSGLRGPFGSPVVEYTGSYVCVTSEPVWKCGKGEMGYFDHKFMRLNYVAGVPPLCEAGVLPGGHLFRFG